MKLIIFFCLLIITSYANGLECKGQEEVFKSIKSTIRHPELLFEGYSKDMGEGSKPKGMTAYYQIFRGVGDRWIMISNTVKFLREGSFLGEAEVCSEIFLGGMNFRILSAESPPAFEEKVNLDYTCPTLENFSEWAGSKYNEFPIMELKGLDGSNIILYAGEESWTLAKSVDSVIMGKKNPMNGSYYDRCYKVVAAGGKVWHIDASSEMPYGVI